MRKFRAPYHSKKFKWDFLSFGEVHADGADTWITIPSHRYERSIME
jgi:hypothetical protein